MPRITNNILSYPLRVEFAGFESDTYRLQQAGWEFSVEENFMDCSLSIIMRNRQRHAVAMAFRVRLDYYRAMDDMEYLRHIVIPMSNMGSEIRLHHHERMYYNFRPADMTPSLRQHEIVNLEDFALFATPKVKAQEIIVPEQSVPELMEMILRLQDEDKTRYYEHKLRSKPREGECYSAPPQTIHHAQILSVA